MVPGVAEDLLKVMHVTITDADHADQNDHHGRYASLGLLTSTNAALARFSSQAFSGTSPILETESHFWFHSLLGTGIANLSLIRIREFLQAKLGEARIPQRIERLRLAKGESVDLNRLPGASETWFEDHLSRVTLPSSEKMEPIVPLLTYYSGRDGFKSTITSLSAPLITIATCNSRRWTLLTITHEVSHSIVRGVLAVLLPDPTSAEELEEALECLSGKRKDRLSRIKQALYRAAIAIYQANDVDDLGEYALDVGSETLAVVLDEVHHDIEELMAHVFDFLYFYGEEVEPYVAGIWLSWSVIPNIANRVPEYVLRTLCAVVASHLRRGDVGMDAARVSVLDALRSLEARGGGPYVTSAVSYLEERWDEIQPMLVVRTAVVRLVRAFIYSAELATELRAERTTPAARRTPGRRGYTFKTLEISEIRFENPLQFIRKFTTDLEPDAAKAAWMLYCLAFNVK